MKTSELIEFLKTQPFTREQAYNLIVNDIFEAVTEDEIAKHEAQKLVSYFMYKIQEVLLPTIEALKP
jgi:nucleoid DNA-binding protein